MLMVPFLEIRHVITLLEIFRTVPLLYAIREALRQEFNEFCIKALPMTYFMGCSIDQKKVDLFFTDGFAIFVLLVVLDVDG